jgi:hypothetical protein
MTKAKFVYTKSLNVYTYSIVRVPKFSRFFSIGFHIKEADHSSYGPIQAVNVFDIHTNPAESKTFSFAEMLERFCKSLPSRIGESINVESISDCLKSLLAEAKSLNWISEFSGDSYKTTEGYRSEQETLNSYLRADEYYKQAIELLRKDSLEDKKASVYFFRAALSEQKRIWESKPELINVGSDRRTLMRQKLIKVRANSVLCKEAPRLHLDKFKVKKIFDALLQEGILLKEADNRYRILDNDSLNYILTLLPAICSSSH